MNNLKNEFKEKLNKFKKINSCFALLRLIFIALAIIVFLSGYFLDKSYLYVLGAISFVIFIVVAIIHSKYAKREHDIEYKLEVISDIEKRRKGKALSSKDNGIEFKSDDNYFEADLDIFGENSLYKYISVAKTGMGRLELAKALKDNDVDKAEILKRQEAVKELSNKPEVYIDLVSKLKAYSASVEDNKPSSMENALNSIENKLAFNKLKLIPAILLEILLISSIVLAALGIFNAGIVVALIIINFFATIFLSAPIKTARSSLIPINNLFYGYADITNAILANEYESELMNEIRSSLKSEDSVGLRRLNRLEPWITSGHNILFEIIFNGLFGFDTWMMLLYEKWQNKYSSSVRNVVSRVALAEVLLSLATLKYSNENAIIPEISEEFKFTNLKHPLINQRDVVGNDFVFDGMNIITGSNMSGKTTFMRTIGISYILFKAGGYVVADSFSAGIYKLYTSMKVTDDVSSGISTFYAEILRIKSIVEYARLNKPMLVLVDEIFKGTNTLDRIKGARKVIESLNKSHIYSIITTHDFELCDTQGAQNYHFKEHYENDEIKFDYKIYDGISETTDAIYLLKMSGIIEE